MTRQQYQMLRIISDGRSFSNLPFTKDQESIIFTCQKEGWVSINTLRQVRITHLGRGAMLAYEEQIAREEAQRQEREAERQADLEREEKNMKRQFRHDWRLSLFEVLGGIFIGLFIEHFFDIAGSILRFFH